MHPTTPSETRPRSVASVPRRRRGTRAPDRRRPAAKPGGAGRHRTERRPTVRGEIDEAARELLARHGSKILATARRYAATPEDAEDAYQRGLEILLSKAPSTSQEDLVPWLKTVVKHEAFALRRQRDRKSPVTDDGELGERGTTAEVTHDQAERYERLRQGAEALRQLKPQEVRALRLKAEGYTYAEICQITGWTYTKVNRCLTEGRRALAIRLAGIQGGIECARLAPWLAALADGETGADEVALLQPHMNTCLCCRARLKLLRAEGGPSPGSGGRDRAGAALQGACNRRPT
jgi:RNA polymerase sigma factor (sigma-70 family)